MWDLLAKVLAVICIALGCVLLGFVIMVLLSIGAVCVLPMILGAMAICLIAAAFQWTGGNATEDGIDTLTREEREDLVASLTNNDHDDHGIDMDDDLDDDLERPSTAEVDGNV